MDFKSMKRKDLQALCKKHGISANSTNSLLAESLDALFKAHEKIKPKGCLKGSGGITDDDSGRSRNPKRVTFLIEDEDVEFAGFRRNPNGKSSAKKRKSSRRRSLTDKGGGLAREKDEVEVSVRSRRSRSLAKGVLWSSVVGKKKKKARNGMEGVCQDFELNSDERLIGKMKKEPLDKMPTTRSLRNRLVVTEGNEGSQGDLNLRTLKRKNTCKEEKYEDFGRKNLRKRPRSANEEVSDHDETPQRRSTRNLSKLMELGTTEVVRVVRSSTSRKRDAEVSTVKPENVGRLDQGRDTVKRPRDSLLNSSGLDSGDAIEAAGQKKFQKQVKSKQGGSTALLLDSEVGAVSVRRSTRSSSNLLEDVSEVVSKDRVRKELKGRSSKRGDLTTSLSDNENVTEPTRRLTRGFLNLLGAETSLLVVGKLHDVSGALRMGKSKKQSKNHPSKQGDSMASLQHDVAITEPTRRSTRSSSKLSESDTSLLAAEKLRDVDGANRKGKTGKQAKFQSQKQGYLVAKLLDSKPIIEPTKRSTRSSSKLSEDETYLGDIDEAEAPRKDKSGKQAKVHVSKKEDLTSTLSDSQAVTKATRRSTRSSSKMSEDETSLLIENLGELNEPVRKGRSGKQAKVRARKQGELTVKFPDGEAVIVPRRRSTRSSSKLLEDRTSLLVVEKVGDVNGAVRKGKPGKQAKVRELRHGDITATLPDSEAVVELIRRSTRNSSKWSEDETSLQVVEKLDDVDEAIRKHKSGKQVKVRASKQGDSTVLLVDSETVNEPTRRSTRSSLMHNLEECEMSLPAARKGKSGKQVRSFRSKGGTAKSSIPRSDGERVSEETEVQEEFQKVTQPEAVNVSEGLEESTRKSRRSPSKMTASDQVFKTKVENKRTRAAALEDISIVEKKSSAGFHDMGTLEEHSNSTRRKSLRNVPVDSDVLQGECSPDRATNLLEDTPKYSNAKGKRLGEKTNKKKKSSPLRKREGEKNITRGEHQKKEDQNISNGDGCLSSGTLNDALSAGISIAVETGTAETEVINDAEVENVSEAQQSPAVDQLQEVENDVSLRTALKDGLDDLSLGSHFEEKKFGHSEMANEVRGMSLSTVIEGPSEMRENVLGSLACPNVEGDAEVGGASESCVGDKDDTLTPVVYTVSTSKANIRGTLVGACDNIDDVEDNRAISSSGLPLPWENSEELLPTANTSTYPEGCLEEPDPKAVHDVNGVVMEGNQTTDVTSPPLPCRSTEVLSLTSNTETYPEVDLEEPEPKAVNGANEDDMADDEANVTSPHLPCRSSEEPSSICDIEISHVFESENHDMKVEDQCPREDEIEGNESMDICSPSSPCKSSGEMLRTFTTEASPKMHIEVPDSKVEVCGNSEMASQYDHTSICTNENYQKSGEILPIASDSDKGELSTLQGVFYYEKGICRKGAETTPNAQVAPKECDTTKEFKEIPAGVSPSRVVLKEIEESCASFSMSVMENDGTDENGRHKNNSERTEAIVSPSSPRKNSASNFSPPERGKGHEIQLSSEEIVESANALVSHGIGELDGDGTVQDKNNDERTEACESPVFRLCADHQVNERQIQQSSGRNQDDRGGLASHGSAKQSHLIQIPVQDSTLANDNGPPSDAALFEDDKQGFEVKNISGSPLPSSCAKVVSKSSAKSSLWIENEDLAEQASAQDFVGNPDNAQEDPENLQRQPSIVSKFNENSSEGIRSQKCKASGEKCNESFISSYVQVDTDEVGSGGAKGECSVEKTIAETRLALLSDNTAFDFQPEDKVQRHGIEMQPEEPIDICLGGLVSGFGTTQRPLEVMDAVADGRGLSFSKMCINAETFAESPSSISAISAAEAKVNCSALLKDKFCEVDKAFNSSSVICNKNEKQAKAKEGSCQEDVQVSVSTSVPTDIVRDHMDVVSDTLCEEHSLDDVASNIIATDKLSLGITESTPPVYNGTPVVLLENLGAHKIAGGTNASPSVLATGCLDCSAGKNFSGKESNSLIGIGSSGLVSADMVLQSACNEHKVGELSVAVDVPSERADPAVNRLLDAEFERRSEPDAKKRMGALGCDIGTEDEEDSTYDNPGEVYRTAPAEPQSEDADHADKYNDAEELEGTSVQRISMIDRTKIGEVGIDVSHCNDMPVSDVSQDAAISWIHEHEKTSVTAWQSPSNLQNRISSDIKESSATAAGDQVEETHMENEHMTVSLRDSDHNMHEHDVIGYIESSEAKYDCWNFEDAAVSRNEDCLDASQTNDGPSPKCHMHAERGDGFSASQGKFYSFEKALLVPRSESNVEEAWVGQNATLRFLDDDLFRTDSEVAIDVGDRAQVSCWEQRLGEENLGCIEGENFMERNTSETYKAAEEKEGMVDIVFSRSFLADSEEAVPFRPENTVDVGSISGSYPGPCAGLEYRADACSVVDKEKGLADGSCAMDGDREICSTKRRENQEEGRKNILETSVVSKSPKDDEDLKLDAGKLEDVVVMEAKSEGATIRPAPAVTIPLERVSGSCMGNSETQIVDQPTFDEFDHSKGSVIQREPRESNEVKDSGSKEVSVPAESHTAQQRPDSF